MQNERHDYLEKVYAGVLGKIIGVYMGRPFENWTYDQITARFGEIDRYVNAEVGAPLVLADDDISGTFTFVRALEDYGFPADLTARAIGQTWLNYLVPNRTILWWGGLGNSTEHTAYLRLRSGIEAPRSGSAKVNGTTTANQIGAQIFIDGWALVSPGNPDRAARLARAAASVSHDEDAVHAAVFVAVLEARAFAESGIDTLLDLALAYVPAESVIARQTRELRDFHRANTDWRAARAWLDDRYSYSKYKGVCHVVPNFGLVILGLLYGGGDFARSMMIINTSGHDTDCNAATLGCILGIRQGLAAFAACPELREGPRDLMFLSSADGSRGVTDALREAYSLANYRYRLDGDPPELPKQGARYHFSLPGAVQGFSALAGAGLGPVSLSNQRLAGGKTRALQLDFEAGVPVAVTTPVFSTESRTEQYTTQASPVLYPGQTLTAALVASDGNGAGVTARLIVFRFSGSDELVKDSGAEVTVEPGTTVNLAWTLPSGWEGPIKEIGVELKAKSGKATVWLDSMGWSGCPQCVFKRTTKGAGWWKDAWVNGVDEWGAQFPESYHLSQNSGTGLVIQGAREWGDYEVQASLTPFQVEGAGLAARVQGMRRYYALVLGRDGAVRLIKERDGTRVLAEVPFGVTEYQTYHCRLGVEGNTVTGWVNGKQLFSVVDAVLPLESGAVALVVTEGTMTCDEVRVGDSFSGSSRPNP